VGSFGFRTDVQSESDYYNEKMMGLLGKNEKFAELVNNIKQRLDK
jgi:hypothetical protein